MLHNEEYIGPALHPFLVIIHSPQNDRSVFWEKRGLRFDLFKQICERFPAGGREEDFHAHNYGLQPTEERHFVLLSQRGDISLLSKNARVYVARSLKFLLIALCSNEPNRIQTRKRFTRSITAFIEFASSTLLRFSTSSVFAVPEDSSCCLFSETLYLSSMHSPLHYITHRLKSQQQQTKRWRNEHFSFRQPLWQTLPISLVSRRQRRIPKRR